MPLVVPSFLIAGLQCPVAVFGNGVSGEGARRLIEAAGGQSRTYDAAGRPFTLADAAEHLIVVFSPGFPPSHPWLALARLAGADCWSELDFASLFWRGRIVAVTGTNGKTTLTELLVHALRSTGAPACAAGNIGRSFSDLAAEREGGETEEIAVCEVSSFQAETLRRFHAEGAIWTNFAEDHLERHGTLADYYYAKAALASHADVLFAGSSVYQAAPGDAASRLERMGRVVWVPTMGLARDARLEGTVFAEPPQQENFVLAAAWWKSEGRPLVELYDAARTFRLGPHRLALVTILSGVSYWNDSKATNFHAVEAALARFPEPVWLIAGGKSKGGDLEGFVRRIKPRVRELILLGDTAEPLGAAAARLGIRHRICAGLRDAVAAAACAAAPGEHVLLSPGFASFDLFRNYQDRGEQFEALVRELGAETFAFQTFPQTNRS